jgi:hypothetical protein
MSNTSQPTVFISYAHQDKQLAINLAERLMGNGVNAWIDVWEIGPGDSLVEKVFEEGLKDCAVFIIILSTASVQSPWVKQELNVAVVGQIRKLTQIIPILAEDCEIPVALRSLRWLDVNDGIDEVVHGIVDAAYRRKPDKPILQLPPDRIKNLLRTKPGFSQEATSLACLIVSDLDLSHTSQPLYGAKALQDALGLTPEQINDGADELATRGLVRLTRTMGTHPFEFAWLEPTYALYYEFSEFLKDKFDPEQDYRQVAACAVSRKEVDGPTLAQDLALPPVRVNFAVAYLADYGIVKVIRELGTSPYDFSEVLATSATRRFVSDQAN